ncbi:MAG: mannitol dehydrogenase family protein, partial [Pseudomonadota bacterium]
RQLDQRGQAVLRQEARAHIGVGNFHRAHMAWHLHRLMQRGEALNWAILGAGVRPADADMRARLLAQDGLTTLIELSPDRAAAEIIGPMVDFLPVQPDNAALIGAMADPAIRIVSLTVTEGGYYLDPLSGGLDLAHPDIRADAAAPQAPRTAFGALVAALARRRDAGLAPFAALSCDNLQGNGDILRAAVVSLARLSDPALADWIAARGAFPNSMVDCIVPATGPAERALARALGLADAAPVTHEPFRQWVIEDRFPAGRPAWEKVGAVFTDDVHAYETMKLRLLNAGHQLLANAGEILGVETIAECMAHPRIGAFFDRALRTEVAPFVPAVPGMTPQAYVDLISGRFANAAVRDTARRVAFDGSARHAGFVHPSLRDALAAGAPLDGLALAEALWARMCAGHRQDGSAIAPNDPAWPALTAAAQAARADPAAWLAQADLYGDLARARPFAQAFDRWLRLIWSDGAEAALAAYAD